MLLLTMHHIVSDGWSMGVLLQELSALYEAFSKGRRIRCRRWRSSMRTMRRGSGMAGRGGAGATDCVLGEAAGGSAGAAGAAHGSSHVRRSRTTRARRRAGAGWGADAGAEAVEPAARDDAVHDPAGGMGGTAGRLSGQEEVVIGTPVANRGRAEMEGADRVLRQHAGVAHGAGRVAERGEQLLARVRELVSAAQDHQDLPFEQVVEIVQPPRRLNHTPLFQVVFDWQNAREGRLHLARYGAETAPLKSDCIHKVRSCVVVAGGQGSSRWRSGVCDGAVRESRQWNVTQSTCACCCGAWPTDEHLAISRIPMLPEVERKQVVHGWNRTAEAFPGDRCVHELFEEQVAQARTAWQWCSKTHR